MKTTLRAMPLVAAMAAALMSMGTAQAQKADAKSDIAYEIMVQRATQGAIWGMPGVALVDFKKATVRDLGGTINDVVYLTEPFSSRHGFITANDVTAYAWGMDATPSSYNSLPVYDHTFFEDLNDLIQSNPVRTQDKAMVGSLEILGIRKGQPFEPSKEQKRAMNEGLKLAFDHLSYLFTTPGKSLTPLWKGKSEWQAWKFAEGQPEAGFPFETPDKVLVDERAGMYFFITYLPKYLGGGTFYLTGIRDGDGELYNGKDTYKLNVPKDVSAKDFWSVIVYSMKSKGFVQNAERVGLSSRNADTMKANKDGSYDVYFGPKAPAGKEANWIPTGEDFFLLFRLYGPETKDFFKTWSIGDVEKVK